MKIQVIRTAVLGAAALCCTGFSPAQDTAAQDKQFLTKAAEGNMAEIAMSKVALKKSKNDEVKTYAQKMIDDHTTMISNMKPVADKLGVQPPAKLNAEHQAEAARLKSMSGDKFDKEFITAMVADHHKDVEEFTAEQNVTQDSDVKALVTQGMPIIKMHTEMIDQMAQKNGITTPPMPAASM